jgi:murein DD-endopeptidase MepM/ murein hydrolase activator NlpD
MREPLILLGLCLATASAGAAERVEIDWPTPGTAWRERQGPDAFLQHAGTGDPAAGGYGGVRENGTQFHEGIDIRAVSRDRAGEATDAISAAMDGVVRYVNTRPGESAYGRYIVIEHPEAVPQVYTLYAHLARVSPGIAAGAAVTRGQVICTMGRSASGYTIPRERAHLHFEIGLWLTRDFQSWYNFRRFGSPNTHGIYNGFNLMGINPLDFMNRHRAGEVDNFTDYLARQETAVRVRIATAMVPDFVQRYPELLTKPMPLVVAGWDVRLGWTGLPLALTPLDSTEIAGLVRNEPRIVEVNPAVQARERSRSLVVERRGAYAIGDDLRTTLQLLFGLR